MEDSEILLQLNPSQREAVLATDGPMLVLAGAGSGKTRVIAHKIAYLIKEKHVSPYNILAVTFTNKAAEEMQKRVAILIGGLDRLWIGTFHSICTRILRKDGKALSIDTDFTICDSDESEAVIRRIIKDIGFSGSDINPRYIASEISRAKNRGLDFKNYLNHYKSPLAQKVGMVYKEYERILLSSSSLDFDDLLFSCVRLLEDFEDAATKYQERFRYILVDEYQDTNTLQYKLIVALSKGFGNIHAVGDEDQSIYKFRGSDIRNILSFEHDFPSARVIKLEQNYRSNGNILKAANGVISNNKKRIGKNLWTERKSEEPIWLYEAMDDREEARFVVERVIELHRRYTYGDFAVLYRTNSQSRAFEEIFLNNQIPYQVVGAPRFYERKEVKDIIAYLKLLSNPNDVPSFMRVFNIPPRGLGKTTEKKVLDFANSNRISPFKAILLLSESDGLPARSKIQIREFYGLIEDSHKKSKQASVDSLIELIIEKISYLEYLKKEGASIDGGESRIENIKELVSAAKQFESSNSGGLVAFLERLALLSEQDHIDSSIPSVKLMTLHASKGLEFPVVFMVGMEEGLFPSGKAGYEEEELEEERRLCYVGMTRTMDVLYLTHARIRTIYGNIEPRQKSRFISEVPDELISKYDTILSEPTFYDRVSMIVPETEKRMEKKLKVGCKVRHPIFGYGILLSKEGEGDDGKLTVSFNNFGRKKIMQRYARLDVV